MRSDLPWTNCPHKAARMRNVGIPIQTMLPTRPGERAMYLFPAWVVPVLDGIHKIGCGETRTWEILRACTTNPTLRNEIASAVDTRNLRLLARILEEVR